MPEAARVQPWAPPPPAAAPPAKRLALYADALPPRPIAATRWPNPRWALAQLAALAFLVVAIVGLCLLVWR